MTLLERLLEKYERDQNLKVVEEETRQSEAALQAQIHQLHVQILFARWLGETLGTIINPTLITTRPGASNCNRLEQDRWMVRYLDRPTGGVLACESPVYLRRETDGNFTLEVNIPWSAAEPDWSACYNGYTSLVCHSFWEALSWLRRTHHTTKEKS